MSLPINRSVDSEVVEKFNELVKCLISSIFTYNG